MAEKKECPNKVWLRRTDEKTRTIIHISPPCGRKSCAYCANEIRKDHYKRIAYVMTHKSDMQWFFVTTTGKSWWHKVDDKSGVSLSEIRKVWAKFRKRLARKALPSDVLYVRVYEQHKSGVFHMHAIIGVKNDFWAESGIGEYKTVKTPSKRKQKRKYSVTKARIKTDRRVRWVRQAWRECGGGYQIHLKQIFILENAHTPIKYVVKYTVKGSTETSRLVEYCRKFPKMGARQRDKTKYTWVMLGYKPSNDEIKRLKDMGYAVVGVD